MKQSRGRPKAFDEQEALERAMNYFWKHGYDNTSLDKLLPEMGIKKSSFYHTFKSKENLFSRALHLYREETLSQLEGLKQQLGAKETLLTLTTFTIDELKSTGSIKGCLLVNSGQECYNKYPDLSKQIATEYNYFLKLFESFIAEAQNKKQIKNKLDARLLAGRYLNVLNGLLVTIQAGVHEETIEDLVISLKEMLE